MLSTLSKKGRFLSTVKSTISRRYLSNVTQTLNDSIELPEPLKYYAVNKPFDMLSQFTTMNHDMEKTLKTLPIPHTDVYAAGRLDMDSEGLLLLSNDNKFIQHLLSLETIKEYIVQVDNEIDEEKHIQKLLNSSPPMIEISLKHGKHKCRPLDKAEILEPCVLNNFEQPEWENSIESKLWKQNHVRKRKNKPTQFMKVAIRGGKNRQIRKMLAYVGLPVLRLVRTKIGNFDLEERMDVKIINTDMKIH